MFCGVCFVYLIVLMANILAINESYLKFIFLKKTFDMVFFGSYIPTQKDLE